MASSTDHIDAPLAIQAEEQPTWGSAYDTAAVADYSQYYGFSRPPDLWGNIGLPGERVAVRVWKNERARGTLLLVHGYLDHGGQWATTVNRYLALGWNLVVMDLPGHGLSEGPRCAIDSFAQYGDAVHTVWSVSEVASLARPWIGVGHSTGGSALLEAQRRALTQMDGVMLLAPLVRHAWWHLGKWGTWGFSSLLDGIPRRTKHVSSHDSGFMERLRRDPLQGRRVPLVWNQALYAWEASLATHRWRTTPYLVIQGTADDVVDGKYNTAYLWKQIEHCRIHFVEGAFHHLHNENEARRTEVWQTMDTFLDSVTNSFSEAK